jgi:hypothetical protein
MTQGVFLRQASGLIRTVNPRDVFIYNMGLVNIGIGLATMMLLGPAYYAGTSIWVSCVIVGAFCGTSRASCRGPAANTCTSAGVFTLRWALP